MKKIFLIIAVMFCAVVSYAQNTHKNHLIELNFGIVKDFSDSHNHSAYCTVVYDYVTRGNIGTGLGVGFFDSQDNYIPNSYTYYSYPVFADFRWMPNLTRTIKFIGVLNGGFVINSSDRHSNATDLGHYLSAQAGFRIKIVDMLGLNARFVYNNFKSFETISSIGGIIGLSFSF